MKVEDITGLPSMPLAAPSYPRGPYRFIDREYLIVTYKSDPDAIRAALPAPLQPDGTDKVLYEFIRMPDSAGFGDYTESGVVIPAVFGSTPVNFTAQMYLDDEPPIAGGREVWGFPKKNADPRLSIVHDTLTGVLEYAGIVVAVATMGYKHQHLLYDVAGRRECSPEAIVERMRKTQVNLKLIPTWMASWQSRNWWPTSSMTSRSRARGRDRRGCSCTRTSTLRWQICQSGRPWAACISSPI
jgi:acetoacetate decarboxylase